MRLRTAILLVAALIVPVLAGADDPNPPPPAPEGYAWKRIESVKASFLVPAGWHFKEETTADGTRAFFIILEDIDKAGVFETGLSVNVIRLKKDPAQQRAAQYIADLAAANEVQEAWQMGAGVMKGFGVRVRHADSDGPALIEHVLTIGNSRTNTLYIILFESPELAWPAAWKKGEKILEAFLLDDEV